MGEIGGHAGGSPFNSEGNNYDMGTDQVTDIRLVKTLSKSDANY
jgi:hypothetical protein